jgi:hypothetical protein
MSGRDRAYHYRIADASAKEVDSHLQLLLLSGAVHRGKATTTLQLVDDVRAMIWRLRYPTNCSSSLAMAFHCDAEG